jgi:hypothetical protein
MIALVAWKFNVHVPSHQLCKKNEEVALSSSFAYELCSKFYSHVWDGALSAFIAVQSMFHLKHYHNYSSICKLRWHQYNRTNQLLFSFHLLRKTEQIYSRYPPPPRRHTNTSCVPKFCYQSVYCCLIRYFLVRIRIAKCFTNSTRRFRCEVMFWMNTSSARQ